MPRCTLCTKLQETMLTVAIFKLLEVWFNLKIISCYYFRFKATTQGSNKYNDMPIDIPNYLNTHGNFNSESIRLTKPQDHGQYLLPHFFYFIKSIINNYNLIIRFHELKCPGKEIIKATTWGPRHNNAFYSIQGFCNVSPIVALWYIIGQWFSAPTWHGPDFTCKNMLQV